MAIVEATTEEVEAEDWLVAERVSALQSPRRQVEDGEGSRKQY